MIDNVQKIHKADVLIVVVTPVEAQAVLAAAKAITNESAKPLSINDRTYRNLGVIGGCRVFMATSEMGTGGVGGSQKTVDKAIEALNPSAVIMVGIAFGVDRQKQKIGDILFSKQILLYELQRKGVGSGGESITHLRGDRAHAAPRLISWLSDAALDWDVANGAIQSGLILSGEKLIDDSVFRDDLKKLAGEVVGGEMEGAGIYAACHEPGIPWMLVKAICDWADGNKGKNKAGNQKKAAHNAATFVLNALCHVSPVDVATAQIVPKIVHVQVAPVVSAQSSGLYDEIAILATKMQLNTSHFPTYLVDDKIQEKVKILRKTRFLRGSSAIECARDLGDKIQNGEFSVGSKEVRSSALAWCARILGDSVYVDQSKAYLKLAVSLDNNEFTQIAQAFIIAKSGQIDDAIALLAKIPLDIARSAVFFIQKNYRDAETAIKWLGDAGIDTSQLDADGKLILITSLLELGHWDEAFACADKIEEQDFQAAPALLWQVAMACLVRAIAEEFRHIVLQHIPLDAAAFPLAGDDKSWYFRRKAVQLFASCARVTQDLTLHDAANTADDYALWLELLDPLEKKCALAKLEASMSDHKHALRRIPLAIQFLANIDSDAFERLINRETALTAGKSINAALARLALVFHCKDPKIAAEYIEAHREQIYQYISKEWIQGIEVEILAKAGLSHQAALRLAELKESRFPAADLQRLRLIVDSIQGQDQTEKLKAAYTLSNSINDLNLLISSLKNRDDGWREMVIYSTELFSRTKAITDAEELAIALIRNHRFKDLGELIRRFPEFLEQSEKLQAYWCMVLYREGALVELGGALKRLRIKRDHPDDRRLAAELAITSGNWEELVTIAEEEWGRREHRSAMELLQAAYAAQMVGSPRAKELTYAAAEKGNGDPNILIGAYHLAVTANWENDQIIFDWMKAAANLSNDDGPVWSMSLKDLVDIKPDWDLCSQNTMAQIEAGELPIFGAEGLLNQSLVSMVLLPSLVNLNESDPRRRRIIPAFSGARPAMPIEGDSIAIESMVLLTLAQLDMLNALVELFPKIIIPHSTLRWLYKEKQQVAYHQPSRVVHAQELKRLIASGSLQAFTATAARDADLAAEIGEDLAAFIAEAHSIVVDEKVENKKFIIVSSPVYRITSLMEQEADLSAHASYLCSSNAVLNKLREKGQLTLTEFEYAKGYLESHEKAWPSQPVLPDGAIIYLDNTIVAYLQRTKLLGKLKSAGLTAYIATSGISEADSLINYDALTTDAGNIIEKIRKFLVSGLNTKKISLAPMPDDFDDDMERQEVARGLRDHPTMAVFAQVGAIAAIVVDDRALNRHMKFSNGGDRGIRISTTIDLLNAFLERGIISKIQLFEIKTKLRQACYIFIPMAIEELQCYFDNSIVKDGKILENAELRAIRENMLRVRMSNFLQLPQEEYWFNEWQKMLLEILWAQWQLNIDENIKHARSNWLLRLLDLRGWAHVLKHDDGLGMINIAYGEIVTALILSALGMRSTIRESYFSWLESILLLPLKNENPDLWIGIIEQLKRIISNKINRNEIDEGK